MRFSWQLSQRPSLRSQLIAVFMLLILMAIGSFAVMLNEQRKIAVNGSDIASRSHNELVNSFQLDQSLNEIQGFAVRGEINANEIARFRGALSRLRGSPIAPESELFIGQLQNRFDVYLGAIQRGHVDRIAYEDLAASVNGLIDLNQNLI